MAIASSQRQAPSLVRAWIALVIVSWQRQARARQMVWIALGLLVLATAIVAMNSARQRYAGLDRWSSTTASAGSLTARPGWGMFHWRHPRGYGPTFDQFTHDGQLLFAAIHRDPSAIALDQAVFGAARAIVANSGFIVFSRWVVFSIFLSFL